MLTLHRDLDYAHADTNIVQTQSPALQAIIFFGTSLPPKRGAGWSGGARSSSSKNPQLPQQQQQQQQQQRARSKPK